VEHDVISIECDNCDKVFEVEPDAAGTRIACPHCGDVNRVPAAASSSPPPAPATGTAPPEAEREICVVRPGMFRAHPFRYLLILLLFVGGLTLAGCATFSVIAAWLAIPGLVIAVFGLGWFASWWMSTHWWVRLVVSNKRSIRHEGIIKRHTTEVLHDHVRSVDINQSFMQRILGVGVIGIDSAGQDGIEIEVRDIPNPYEVKRVIDQYRRM
jgi:hypothetical protein